MIDAMQVEGSFYFATLQGYVIFETGLYRKTKKPFTMIWQEAYATISHLTTVYFKAALSIS